MAQDLKDKARTLKPIVIIGKFGLTDNQVEEIKKVLRTQKLIKIKLLQSVSTDPQLLAEEIGAKTSSKVISVVGKMIVVWKR